jgi:cell division protein FtsB
MKFLTYIPSFLKNKFFLTGIGFVVWLLFFDKNDILTQVDRYREMQDLRQSADYYKKQIAASRQEIKDLQTNPHHLEKTAREKYYFHRDNEDVYVIENK